MVEGITKKTATVTSEDGWTYTFTNLPRVNKNGVTINYSVVENSVPAGYTASAVSGNMTSGFAITNSHTPEKITISGTKHWEYPNNVQVQKPNRITIDLLADGNVVESRQINASTGWTYTFTARDKYKAGAVGQEIAYTLNERGTNASGLVTINGEEYKVTTNGTDITNTLQRTIFTIDKTSNYGKNGNVKQNADIKYTITVSNVGNKTGSTSVRDSRLNGLISSRTLSTIPNNTGVTITYSDGTTAPTGKTINDLMGSQGISLPNIKGGTSVTLEFTLRATGKINSTITNTVNIGNRSSSVTLRITR